MSNEKSFTEMIIASMVHCSQTLLQCNSVGLWPFPIYSEKFSHDPNFHDFHDPRPKHEIFTCILCACLSRSDNGTVPLFQQADNVLYSPTGHLQPLLVCVKIHSAQLNVLQAFNAPLWLVSINLLLVFLHRPVLGY